MFSNFSSFFFVLLIVPFLAHQNLCAPTTTSMNLMRREMNKEMNNNMGEQSAQDLNRRDGHNGEEQMNINERRTEHEGCQEEEEAHEKHGEGHEEHEEDHEGNEKRWTEVLLERSTVGEEDCGNGDAKAVGTSFEGVARF